VPCVARREVGREGQGRTHADDMGRGRVPGDDSGQAEAKLDCADQTVDGRSSRRATVTRHRSVVSGFSRTASVLFVVLLAVIVRSAAPSADAQAPAAPAAAAPASAEAAFLNQYCIGCHNQRAKIGGLALDTLDVSRVGPASETWEKVVKKIRTGMMPPSGAKRPE